MNILHGFWSPAADKDFIQSGHFYIWIETENIVNKVKKGIHPRNLKSKALVDFIENDLKFLQTSRPLISEQKFLLPSTDNSPLPSPELISSFDDDVINKVELKSWQIECLLLAYPLQAINQIHFLCHFQDMELRLGNDFLFWYYFSQSITKIINREQFIPSFIKGKGNKTKCNIYSNWQIVSSDYEHFIEAAKAQIPPVCCQEYQSESLLRHFAEVTIDQVLETAKDKTSQALQKRFNGTLLEDCFVYSKLMGPEKYYQDEFEKWTHWQQSITEHINDEQFQLGFRLEEAKSDSPNDWLLCFTAITKQQDYFTQDLTEYWTLSVAEKKELAPFIGKNFEQQLLLKLGIAARIYPKIWDGMDTETPQSISLSLEEAFEFLKETAWVLEDAGFKVMVPSWWTPKGRKRAKIRISQQGRSKNKSTAKDSNGLLSFENLTDYRYQLSIGEQNVTHDEWQQLVNAKTPLIQFRGQWMALESEQMQQMLAFWQQNKDKNPDLSIPELLKILADEEDIFELDPNDALAQMLDKLKDTSQLVPIENPQHLNATLRDYQKRGVAWLSYLEKLGLNGCLADDMGLGKTIQVIANLVIDEKTDKGATLLIAPTSVIGNWQKEIERFAPHLKTVIHHGSKRLSDNKELKAVCANHHMVITSYNLARKDIKLLESIEWQRVVLDEAQNIKNPKSAQTKAIYKLPAVYRLALTGTPVENRLMDLWAIFNFLNPGYLGSQASFRKTYELPIQKYNDAFQTRLLKNLVEPFILRRLKTDKNIIKDLPDKVDNKQYCNLTKEQAALYEVVVDDVAKQLDEKEGIERQGLMLSTLMKLKQICNHPRQFLQDNSDFSQERSDKLARLDDMLEEVKAEGDSALIFTQFTEIGEQLVKHLEKQKRIKCFYLHGGVSRKKREAMITEFQDPNTAPSVFVLSLKAGGVGITLTRANHVFHFDRWWNPAVEDQASDRAFRIGQKKKVFVHKFITIGTLEERIDEMIEDKKKIAGSIVGNNESWLTKLDNEAFKSLIALNKQAINS